MSLLLEHGHRDAMEYRIGLVWEEAQMVTDRLNTMEATRATLLQQAIGSVLSKDGNKAFQKTVKTLLDNGE